MEAADEIGIPSSLADATVQQANEIDVVFSVGVLCEVSIEEAVYVAFGCGWADENGM